MPVRRVLLPVAVAVAVLGSVVVLAQGRVVVSGWRVFECGRMGGSWPVELADEVELRAGFDVGELAAVRDGGLTFVAAEILRVTDGRAVGIGVWAAGDDVPQDRVGAVDGTARRWSHRHAPVSGHDAAVGGARGCARALGR